MFTTSRSSIMSYARIAITGAATGLGSLLLAQQGARAQQTVTLLAKNSSPSMGFSTPGGILNFTHGQAASYNMNQNDEDTYSDTTQASHPDVKLKGGALTCGGSVYSMSAYNLTNNGQTSDGKTTWTVAGTAADAGDYYRDQWHAGDANNFAGCNSLTQDAQIDAEQQVHIG